jgi:cell fate regulator YaaT (PSP1 superfamily)
VSLRTAGKIYYFDPGTAEYEREERVLVETARGVELGRVKLPPHKVDDAQIVPPLKPVVRHASTDDLARDAFNRDREANALELCKRLVDRLHLPMRLIDAQYTFDGSHVLIHFLADNRVDFRELVRELAHELHTRIELRQVGVRDEAKLLGGHGICGRQLCCSAFLANFVPVAITTAKDQGLALNPQKISGMCGRLMCCLAFEHECYREESKGLPRMNSTVATPRGAGRVTKLNVLARQVEVTIPELPSPLWFPVNDLTLATPAGQDATTSGCPGCPAHAAESLHPNLDEKIQYARPDLHATAVTAEEEDESAAPGEEQPRRRRPRRRRKSDSPATTTQTSPVAEPASGSAQAQQQSTRPRRRRPRNNNAGAPMPLTALAPPEGAAPQPANPAGSGRRRRRRRR